MPASELARRLRRLATTVEGVPRVHHVHLSAQVLRLEQLVDDALRPSDGPARARAELARLRASRPARLTLVEDDS